MMKKWTWALTLLTLLILGGVNQLVAQPGSPGFWVRTDCTTLTGPVNDQTLCQDSTAQALRVFSGGSWRPLIGVNGANTLFGTQGSVEPALRIATLDPTFRFSILETSTIFNSVRDNILYIGYNTAGNGARENTSEPALWLGLEANFRSSGAGPNFMEWNMDYVSATGTSKRFLGFQVDRGTDVSAWSVTGDTVAIENPINTQQVLFTNSTNPKTEWRRQSTLRASLEMPLVNQTLFRIRGDNSTLSLIAETANKEWNIRPGDGVGKAAGSISLLNLTDSIFGFTINSTGQIALGNPASVASATAGEVVLGNAKNLRGTNSGGGSSLAMIEIDASNRVVLSASNVDILWGVPLVALGGGAAPTFGTIGGSGPATAAQNSWMRVIDTAGAAFWVPVWK